MNRSIHFIFDLLPPEQESIPEKDERIAATMLLQSYFINVQGCLDNIAWVWVHETDQRGPDGNELKRGMVLLADEADRGVLVTTEWLSARPYKKVEISEAGDR